jgi:hypothetical protein
MHYPRTILVMLVLGGLAVTLFAVYGAFLQAAEQERMTWTDTLEAKNEQGLSTGVNIAGGSKITVTAAGSAGYRPDGGLYGPGGNLNRHDNISGLMFGDKPVGALVLTIGSTAEVVGGGLTDWEVPGSGGTIVFKYNDKPKKYGDNRGSFRITMTYDSDTAR